MKAFLSRLTKLGVALTGCLACLSAQAADQPQNRTSLSTESQNVIVTFSISSLSSDTPAEDKFINPNLPLQKVFLANLIESQYSPKERKAGRVHIPQGYISYKRAYRAEQLFFPPELLYYRAEVNNLDDYIDMVTYLNNRFLIFLHDNNGAPGVSGIPPLYDTPANTLQTVWDQIHASCQANNNWQLDLASFSNDVEAMGLPQRISNRILSEANTLAKVTTQTCNLANQTAQLMKTTAFSNFFDVFDKELVSLQYRFLLQGKLRENPYQSFDQLSRVFTAYMQTRNHNDAFVKAWENYDALSYSRDASAFLKLRITDRKLEALAKLDQSKATHPTSN